MVASAAFVILICHQGPAARGRRRTRGVSQSANISDHHIARHDRRRFIYRESRLPVARGGSISGGPVLGDSATTGHAAGGSRGDGAEVPREGGGGAIDSAAGVGAAGHVGSAARDGVRDRGIRQVDRARIITAQVEGVRDDVAGLSRSGSLGPIDHLGERRPGCRRRRGDRHRGGHEAAMIALVFDRSPYDAGAGRRPDGRGKGGGSGVGVGKGAAARAGPGDDEGTGSAGDGNANGRGHASGHVGGDAVSELKSVRQTRIEQEVAPKPAGRRILGGAIGLEGVRGHLENHARFREPIGLPEDHRGRVLLIRGRGVGDPGLAGVRVGLVVHRDIGPGSPAVGIGDVNHLGAALQGVVEFAQELHERVGPNRGGRIITKRRRVGIEVRSPGDQARRAQVIEAAVSWGGRLERAARMARGPETTAVADEGVESGPLRGTPVLRVGVRHAIDIIAGAEVKRIADPIRTAGHPGRGVEGGD